MERSGRIINFIFLFCVLLILSPFSNSFPQKNILRGQNKITKNIGVMLEIDQCKGLGDYCNPREKAMCCHPFFCNDVFRCDKE